MTTDGSKPPYPMTKEQRRQWLDNLTPEDRAKLRAEHEKTREPWEPKRRENRMIAAYRKQRDYIVQDMHRGASLQVAYSPAVRAIGHQPVTWNGCA